MITRRDALRLVAAAAVSNAALRVNVLPPHVDASHSFHG